VTVDIPTPFELPTATVLPEWIDHNGHMNMAYYLLAFDLASDVLADELGLDSAYKKRTNTATFAAETHINYKRELLEGDPLRFTGRVIACDAKRMHYWLEMFHGTQGYLAATTEFLILHVDMKVRRVTAMEPEQLARIEAVRDAHAALPRPADIGHVMGVPGQSG
jgi:acyl-CoA thioester hydrolase